MTVRLAARSVALAFALAAPLLTGCAAERVTAGTPKSVNDHPLPPYQMQEECVRLMPGDRIDYVFESSEPIDFSIRYRESNAVLMPVTREQSRADGGVFAAQIAQDYCLTWEAGAAGAMIDYRIRLRPAVP